MILTKWINILNIANIKNNQNTIALYCDNFYNKIIDEIYGHSLNKINIYNENILPLNLRILSNINLKEGNLILTEKNDITLLEHKIYFNIEDLTITQLAKFEDDIVEIVSNYINNKMNNGYDTLYLNCIKIHSINNKDKITISLNLSFFSQRLQKLESL